MLWFILGTVNKEILWNSEVLKPCLSLLPGSQSTPPTLCVPVNICTDGSLSLRAAAPTGPFNSFSQGEAYSHALIHILTSSALLRISLQQTPLFIQSHYGVCSILLHYISLGANVVTCSPSIFCQLNVVSQMCYKTSAERSLDAEWILKHAFKLPSNLHGLGRLSSISLN